MENSSEDSGYTDLLSAALSESGLAGDFFDFSDPSSAGTDVTSNTQASSAGLYPAVTHLPRGTPVQAIPGRSTSQPVQILRNAAQTTTVNASGQKYVTISQPTALIKSANGQVVSGAGQGTVITASRPQPTIIRTTSAQQGTTVIHANPGSVGTVRTSLGQPGTVIRTVNGQLPSGIRLVAKTVASPSASVGTLTQSVRPQMVMSNQPGTPVTSKLGQKIITVSPHVNADGKKMYTITRLPPGAVIQGNKVILPNKTVQNSTTASSPLVRSQTLPASLGAVRTVTPGSTVPRLIMTPKVVASSQVNNSPQMVRAIAPVRAPGPQRVIMTGGGATIPNPMLSSFTSDIPTPVKTELTNKDVAKLWVNEDIRLKRMASAPVQLQGNSIIPISAATQEQEEAEEEEEEQELGVAETYANYYPTKLRLGEKHPDPVVETSSLSSVTPPDIWYKLSIPESVIDYGHLSALQLESIVYTCQKHENFLPSGHRAGFLIGDGAGVGKGRTIAGVIFENYLVGRKRALWLSVSNDLRVDAERDLRDIGAGKIEVHPLNKFKYAKISSHINGSVKKGVIFATYSSLIGESQSGGKYRTRLKQLIHWLGKEFDGLIVFDECHKAKNLCPVGSSKPTKTGMTVLELQNKLPKARIVYASATGASEPRNMAYMTRLGLWGPGTPFKEFNDFIQAIEKRGVGAMELVAMDMKLRGMYIARQLSFHGVGFKIEEIPIPKEFYMVYNESVKLWVDAREMFQQAAELMAAEHRMKKSMWGQFWSAHQRFFKYLCISAKVPHCIQLARESVKNGKCIVIGLQSTGEARTLEQVEEMGGELTDFVSTAKGVFQTLVEKHFPAADRRKALDLFGLKSSLLDSPVPSPKIGDKRKKVNDLLSNANKRAKQDWSSDSEDSKSDKSASDASESEVSDVSVSQSSEDESEVDDDFNPFGNGSDSDDDPWLKKSKKTKKPKEKKKKEKEKKVKEKKEKKEKKKKDKKKKKEKKDKGKESDDSDDDIDNECDRVLAGLKSNSNFASLSRTNSSAQLPGMDAVDKARGMRQELLARIERLGGKLPANTLDELIDQLGGPDCVAEMTGRKGRVVSTEDGSVQYESRSESDVPLEILNLTEKQRFMDGEKNIAVISEAASSGISLQADRRAMNQRRRVHITLELPWSADRAIQQFGRTHRSNQVSAPEYVFMISELAGERRFAATVAKRLESLGALTHGDRRATESRDLSKFNIDNKYGRAALESVMRSILGIEPPLVRPPETYKGNFFKDCQTGLVGVGLLCDEHNGPLSLEKEYNNISKFLNRILGLQVDVQNALFAFFQKTLRHIILEAKRFGRWDMGILDIGSNGENVREIDIKHFSSDFGGGTLRTRLHTITVERGMTWEAALDKWRSHGGAEDGFYISAQQRSEKSTAILIIEIPGRKRERLFNIFRPNTGLQLRAETLAEIKSKYKKVLPQAAQQNWLAQFEASATVCSHAYWKGNCKKVQLGLPCEIGLRSRKYHILSGSVLGCWKKVEKVLASLPSGHASRMQIIRLRTSNGGRIVGTLIPEDAIKPLSTMLSQDWADKSKMDPSVAVHSMVNSKSQLLNTPMQRLSSMLPDRLTGPANFRGPSGFNSSSPPFRLSINNGNLIKTEPMIKREATPPPVVRLGRVATPPLTQLSKPSIARVSTPPITRVGTPPMTRVATPPNMGGISLLATPPPTPTSTATSVAPPPSSQGPPPPPQPLLSMPTFF